MSDKLERVRAIIAEELGVELDRVTPEADISDDLGADSLDTVELVMRVEEEYGIEIDDDAAVTLRTANDIASYLETVVTT